MLQNNLDVGGELPVLLRSGVKLIINPELLGLEQITSAKMSNPKSDAGLYLCFPLSLSFFMIPKFKEVS